MDWRLRKADPFLVRLLNGLWRPTKIRVLGRELAGKVVSVGKNVTRFRPGDDVFGGSVNFGAHAEYVCVPAEGGAIAVMPDNMRYEEAAGVRVGATSALHFLRKANVQVGQQVLVYGASGSVGTFAVQLAKHFGAHVTGVCSAANLDLVKSLGADAVVDYTREDFSKAGRFYEVVFDTVGKSGFSRAMKSLRRGGAYVQVAGVGPLWMLRAVLASSTGAAKVFGGMASGQPGDMAFLKRLIEARALRTVIDRRYCLEQVADAYRYVEAGHKKGNVILVIRQSDDA